MTNALTIAQNEFLLASSLDERAIESLLKLLAVKHIDAADLYFQTASYESWYLEEGEVKSGSFSIEKGVGVRAVSGEKTGYAYSDNISLDALTQAAVAARSIAYQSSLKPIALQSNHNLIQRYAPINPIEGLNKQEKIKLLESIDKYARSLDPRVVQVNASLSASYEVVMIAGLQAQPIADIRPMVSVSVSVVVEQNGRKESGRSGGGGRYSFDTFLAEDLGLEFAKSAVREALINLDAVEAPAGTMTVVLGAGWPGVLLHEAVGHGLEGDFNRKGLSAFAGRLGQQVAAKGITVVDDGTLMNRRGSISVDDEGTPSQCTTLIEDGILVNYMQDNLNAKLMGMRSTGNCRRESYAHVPMPRMTNTYMQNGAYSPEEIIRSVKKGIYAANFGGGQVDITSGQFVFSASEAYLIEDGQITTPVKGATLIGNGPEVMKKISMIGNNLMLDAGLGTCGKEGQSVPVGVGQPTLKIDELTVGGTKKMR